MGSPWSMVGMAYRTMMVRRVLHLRDFEKNSRMFLMMGNTME